jgi:hypothetical protein
MQCKFQVHGVIYFPLHEQRCSSSFFFARRNLFLGYYLPFRHTVPLWEMESDYYLHNFHVKAGRGSTYSMQTYERAFGIDWNDGEDDSIVSTSSVAGTKRRPIRPGPLTTQRSISRDTMGKKGIGESQRISRVRSRCKKQNDVLSTWWKVALQTNIQQRMWMQLGRNKAESLLPPRYERLYQPGKIAQFDRFFARGWAAPVRRSHTAQHSEGSERDAETTELRRVMSGRTQISDQGPQTESLEGYDLKEFVGNYGFEPRFDSSLKKFAEHHDISSATMLENLDFVGHMDHDETTGREEYQRYVTPSSKLFDAPLSQRNEAIEEFKSCLHDYTLKVNDVDDIREVSL